MFTKSKLQLKGSNRKMNLESAFLKTVACVKTSVTMPCDFFLNSLDRSKSKNEEG